MREPRLLKLWIPACAGMTVSQRFHLLWHGTGSAGALSQPPGPTGYNLPTPGSNPLPCRTRTSNTPCSLPSITRRLGVAIPGNAWGIHHQDPPPWNRLLGPVHSRGPVSGTIVLNGETLTSWGEPERADLTFSVAKTYLALLAGVAHDRGLLPDVDEPVGVRVRGIGFDEGRNAQVTWEHLLQQTSEWEGECFGVPDQVDRYRTVQFQGGAAAGRKGDPRPLQAPGTYWEYNDVRINQLSLALLHLFGRPLPEVFRESDHAADRCQRSVALGRVRQRVDRAGWATGSIGSRRHALGRRRVDRQHRSGARRSTAAWTMAGRTAAR